MKIYTKTGDSGSTSLVGGKRVSKAHPRVMAYGDLDELISYLGIIRSMEPATDHVLRRIQIHLMNASAQLASDGESYKLKDLDDGETAFLESEIDRMSALLPAQKAFVLPGKPAASSHCHVARTICRRAERSAALIENKNIQDDKACAYINRLSDYLFTLARFICFKQDVPDDYWLP